MHLILSSAMALSAVLSAAEAAVFTPEFEATLQSFLAKDMACHHIPGLTLSVVKDSDVWTHGYGTADFSSGRQVDPTTLFNIGSVTKSFTVVLLGILLKENGLDWNAKVTKILGPGYSFQDDWRTEEFTLRDLLSHRTGLARLDLGLMAEIPRQLSRQDYCRRMAFLPEEKPPRDTFIYNNYMYMMLGHVAEKLGGDSWENLLTSRVLQPIGMNGTRFVLIPDDVFKSDVAHPYIYKEGTFEKGTHALYTLYPVEPAGAILSNAEDMSKYLQFHINGGKTGNGVQLIDPSLLSEAYTATIPVTGESFEKSRLYTKPDFPASDSQIGYGYAWFISTYRGYRKLWHSGGFESYITLVWILPDMKIGIFGSVNGPPLKHYEMNLLDTALYFIADHLLAEEPWLNDTTACSYPEPWRDMSSEENNATEPDYVELNENVLQEYTGSFGNHILPDITITTSGTKLLLDMNVIKGILHPTSARDKFKFEITGPWEYVSTNTEGTNITETTNGVFNRSRDTDDVISFTLEMEVNVAYTKGVSILHDPFTVTTTETPAVDGATNVNELSTTTETPAVDGAANVHALSSRFFMLVNALPFVVSFLFHLL